MNKWSVVLQPWTLHKSSNTARYSVVKSDTYLVYIDQIELDQFMNIINMFRVGTQQLFFSKIEYRGTWYTWTFHHGYNVARLSIVWKETYLVYIDQLELNQFMKIINIFRVGILPPIFRKSQKFKKNNICNFSKVEKMD